MSQEHLPQEQLENPFVGLRPYETNDSLYYFGRKEQTKALLRLLHQHHFVAVVGSSGAGKSSLIRAGLIPQLEAGFLVQDRDQWRIATMKPGETPLTRLVRSLLQIHVDDKNQSEKKTTLENILEGIEEQGAEALIDPLKAIFEKNDNGSNTNIFLLIDQFEELFRFNEKDNKQSKEEKQEQREQAEEFVSLLLSLSEHQLPIYICLTMRSDFLGDCDVFYGLPEAINKSQFLVPRLTRNQRHEVITNPIHLSGASITSRLLDRLLNEKINTRDDLPVLQHALMRTFNDWLNSDDYPETPIDNVHYERIHTIHGALDSHAKEVLDELDDAQRTIAKKLFQAITTVDAGNRRIRRPTHLDKVAALANTTAESVLTVLNHFREQNRSFLVLSSEHNQNNPLIDISHESLIRQWQQLIYWMDEESKNAKNYQRLVETAKRYKTKDANLYFDIELEKTIEWLEKENFTKAWVQRYLCDSNLAEEFIEVSLKADITRKALEKEKQDEEKRLLKERAELEEQKRILNEQRDEGESFSLWRSKMAEVAKQARDKKADEKAKDDKEDKRAIEEVRGATAENVSAVAPLTSSTREGAGRDSLNIGKVDHLFLKISVRSMDLRYTQHPIICGHYRDDTIAGAEKQIDRRLLEGRLSARHRLGLYASDVGTSTIELIAPNKEAQKRGTNKGALVVGLGDWESITAEKITETIRDGVVTYLLKQKVNTQNNNTSSVGLKLNSMLIGYNSTTHISVESAVDAVVRGVCRANRHYQSVIGEDGNTPVYVNELEFVEYYLDTAITAAHAVKSLSSRINKDFQRMQVNVQADQELRFTGDIRNRLQVNASVGYWPRLMITDADQEQKKCAAECYDITDLSSLSGMPDSVYQQLLKGLCKESVGVDVDTDDESGSESKTVNPPQQYALAKQLKYVFLSEKARAEAQVQQRQPGLIEGLIAQFITQSEFDIGLSRILFQLMIPLDLKAVVRESEQILLVLDGYTAKLPWEMIYVDDQPLAVKAAIVRQFVSAEYRQQVNTSADKRACVIGNPSTANFFNHFTIDGITQQNGGLAPLLGATKEAQAVTKQLKKSNYKVEEVFPSGESSQEIGCSAKDVFNALSKHAYRILMISAHGLVNVQNNNGTRQTGVVLSDGIMLTAAEVRHLEVVPELVFLNCCNLAITDNEATSYNKLAYSLSRELIEMGVRCVVVAGWEVDDTASFLFSRSFFSSFVYEGKPFGTSVWEARKKTYEYFPELNTWGAYQAYGDPAYVLDPGSKKEKEEKFTFVAPQELLEKLSQLRVKNRHSIGYFLEKAERQINKLFDMVPNKSWKEQPEILMEIATLYGELGQQGFDSAITIYKRIIVRENKQHLVPIKAIEQLANLEARSGEQLGGVEGLALIEKAIQRIEYLWLSTGLLTGQVNEMHSSVERSGILGSAHKLKAAVLSRFDKPDWGKISNSLFNCCIAYSTGITDDDVLGDDIYTLLNRIQFEALLMGSSRDDYIIDLARLKSNIILAKRCKTVARERFKESYDFFDAVMAADAELAIMLSRKGLDSASDRDVLLKTYKNSVKGVSFSARQMGSVARNLYLLAEFFKARSGKDGDDGLSAEVDLKVAEHLEYICRTL